MKTTKATPVANLCVLAAALSLGAVLASSCGKEPPRPVAPPEDVSSTPQETQASAPQEEEAAPPISDQDFWDAALEGQTQTVRQAIEQGRNADAADGEGRTALLLAAFNGHTEIVSFLLEQDARVDHRDSAGRTALMYSASGPNPETVSVLLEAGADPNLTDQGEGWSALMFAAGEGNVDVVRVLLRHGVDITILDVDGDTARDFAQRNGHQGVARILSER